MLRSALREYYPGALEAFSDLAHPDALAVLERAPTPAQGRSLTRSQIKAALKRGGRQRNLDTRSETIQAALRNRQLQTSPAVVDALRQRRRQRSGSLENSTTRSKDSKRNSKPILSSTRTPTSSVPSLDSVSYSVPGYSASSGTTRTAMPMRSLAETMQGRRRSLGRQEPNVSCWPATSGTGVSMTPSTNGRSAQLAKARDAERSTTSGVPTVISTTKPYACWETDLLGSSTDASNTTSCMTKTPPGHTANPPSPQKQLDKSHTWGV